MSLQLQNPLLDSEPPTHSSEEAEAAVGTSSVHVLCDSKYCRPQTRVIEDRGQIREIEELHKYLDMVKDMVRPGCPQEMLKVALDSISALSKTLAFMSSSSAHDRLLASL